MKMAVCIALTGLIFPNIGKTRVAERPNILLITSDDLGLNAGCYGDRVAITPNLDRLASEGVRFTRAYVTDALCSPSRSSILTGLYPHQNGQVALAGFHPLHGEPFAVYPGTQTLPKLLKDAGYHTCILGKLHVEPAELFPFDEYPWRETLIKPVETRDVRKVAELAGAFMKESGSRPFFLYVNYFDPHRPYNDTSFAPYTATQCKGLPEKPYTAADVKPFGFLGNAANLAQEAFYYNCVNRLDVGLGLLLDQLKQSGRADRTLIVFISDNGPAFYPRGKTSNYEAGIHVPFIVKWPEVSKASLVCSDLVSGIDIMPTILDAADVKCPLVEGRSLRDVVQGRTPADWRKTVFTEFTACAPLPENNQFYPRRAICTAGFKLIHNLDYTRANPIPHDGF